MSKLEEIWDEQIEDQQIPDTDFIIKRKSSSLFDQFKRQIRIESYIGLIVLLIMVLYGIIESHSLSLVFSIIPLISFIFSIVSLRSINQIDYTGDTRLFINQSVKFIKLFISLYLLSVQLVLVLALFFMEWYSGLRLFPVLLVVTFIELSTIAFTAYLYWPFYKKLRKYQEVFQNQE